MFSSHLKYELKQLAENTSLHGIADIINTKHSVWIRMAWILLFLFMLGVYLFMLCQTLTAYYEYPVATHIEYRTADSIAFPSVTVCNMNIVKYSLLITDDMALHMVKQVQNVSRKLPPLREPPNLSEADMYNVTLSFAHQQKICT